MSESSTHPYNRLTPDVIIAAVESLGYVSDRRILALNSYENRVYQVGIEDGTPLVVKFYGRSAGPRRRSPRSTASRSSWRRRRFPSCRRWCSDGRTLFEYDGFGFAVFERRGGRWPELGSRTEREWMGRFLGRIHMVGRRQRFRHRGRIEIERLGHEPRDYLLEHDWIPPHLVNAYESLTADLLQEIHAAFDSVQGVAEVRLHGDCHRGNVLWTDAGPHFVDLDDCLMGPAIQDLWMLLSGPRREMSEQLGHLLEGYSHFATLDTRELVLIESLRTLRMIHYSAWLARRWSDPAFPAAFPWFIEPRYWENQILALREQLAAIAEGPLEL